jgi:hypothetical protein
MQLVLEMLVHDVDQAVAQVQSRNKELTNTNVNRTFFPSEVTKRRLVLDAIPWALSMEDTRLSHRAFFTSGNTAWSILASSVASSLTSLKRYQRSTWSTVAPGKRRNGF